MALGSNLGAIGGGVRSPALALRATALSSSPPYNPMSKVVNAREPATGRIPANNPGVIVRVGILFGLLRDYLHEQSICSNDDFDGLAKSNAQRTVTLAENVDACGRHETLGHEHSRQIYGTRVEPIDAA